MTVPWKGYEEADTEIVFIPLGDEGLVHERPIWLFSLA